MILTSPECAVPPKLPPHVVMVRNRTGRPYYYLTLHRGTERQHKRLRLPDLHDPAFYLEYARLTQHPIEVPTHTTVSELIVAWHAAPEWHQLSAKTRQEWTRYCQRIQAAWGHLQVKGIAPSHVLALRDSFAATPASANNLLRCLSSLMAWSVPRGWRDENPCREIKPLKGGDGWQPWTWDEIETAERTLRSDLWWTVALALYTGQRQGDVLAMRWDQLSGALLFVRQEKTGKRLAIPVHKTLRAVLDTVPKRAVTILTSTEGRPWTPDGFRATWSKHKPQGTVFHGLRKSAVVTLLEAGCSDAEVAAITGQSRDMIEHYAKMVNQQRLASAAILRWENMERTEIVNTIVNTVGSGAPKKR